MGTRSNVGGMGARKIFDTKQRTSLLSRQTHCFILPWPWGQLSMRMPAILP